MGLPLPDPKGHLTVENLVFRLPDRQKPIPAGVSFEVLPGEALAVIGHSAAGKSSLARMLVGLSGNRRYGAAGRGGDLLLAARRYRPASGYLPQDVELFAGTVADNIARLRTPDAEAAIAARPLADCHEMILRLPKGYDTEIGEGGAMLSSGQRQRIGWRGPCTERRSWSCSTSRTRLDVEGDEALNRAIATIKEAGTTVVIVGHRPSTPGPGRPHPDAPRGPPAYVRPARRRDRAADAPSGAGRPAKTQTAKPRPEPDSLKRAF